MKYEFTGETKNVFGITLHQIRALLSFGLITKGEVGGWIEKEENLSRVSGDAWVYGNAEVSGNARVSDDDNFFLVGPIGSRKVFLTVHTDAKLGLRFTTGCFSDSEKQFRSAIKNQHAGTEYEKQYELAISLALLLVRPK